MAVKGIPSGAWVLIADGEKALYLVNQGDEQNIHLTVRRKEEQDNPKAQDWAASRPGRFNDGPGVQRSAVDDTDWHQLEKARFAKTVAEDLYKAAHAGKFDTLLIAASRPVLSALRNEMHPEVTEKLMLDVPKVLTNHPLDEIEQAILREAENAA
ncbi:host attachment protein [Leisingera methylohalidivorans]|uniref:Host attachment protein n=1 Tax=Leisingera methylohalidivorans DSM 14336 TaxID=999552 RepID=V9W041_9RHOB|nr:host attachment family protein [Leisingera methylohalidivorans]AHD02527.1 Host attachment protein [Leisingera methylohalidivorans DSM 14336]